jgi:hypothetical protein
VDNPLEESLFPSSLLGQSTSRNKVEELDSLLPAPEYPSLTVVPKPGLCVKTKNDKGTKFFVNICKLSEVFWFIATLIRIQMHFRCQHHHLWRSRSWRE